MSSSAAADAWVALLRGVNVNGIAIRSADLRDLFSGLGFDDVRTVLASGNVAFRAAGERGALKTRIEAALRDRFDYDAWIVLVTRDEMADAVAAFPFNEEHETRQPWVMFCVDDATRDELVGAAASLDPIVDPVASGPGVVFWNPAKGSSTDTPFAKISARRAYKERTTTRNLRTLRKIIG